MSVAWHFKKLHPGDKIREPIQSEFFSTDAIRNTAEALVRESIQNSLDAAYNGEKVRVHFFLSGKDSALSALQSSLYFENSRDHFLAEGNGLRDIPQPSDSCPFMVIEDFGTTGLTGDINQWHDLAGLNNPFFYFFRAEGRSGKGHKDRGRWGVGKHVFVRSSRINSFFGLSVRADDGQCILMGQSVLRSHHVGDTYYSPDGWFGMPSADGLILPLSQSVDIEQFSHDFNLYRRTEPGLSIVIPWYDEEITKELLIEGVVHGYFFPILSGKLEVVVDTAESGSEVILNNETLLKTVKSSNGDLAKEILPLLELAMWSRSLSSADIPKIKLTPQDRPPRWSSELINGELLTAIKSNLEANVPLAVRVPITVQPKGEDPLNSFFDVYLVRDTGNESGYPVFIREGIIISDIRRSRVRGIRSLVIVEDSPLASMLGDSENPAHTQWQKDGSNFKGRYKYGSSVIDFVTRSVAELIKILSDQEREEDPTLLKDIFSLPSEPEEEAIKTSTTDSKQKAGEESPIEKPPKESSPRKFHIQKVSGGFTVSNGEGFVPPSVIDIRVAYDVRRGSPLKKYRPVDFELDKDPINVESPEGVDILYQKYNRLIMKAREQKFRIALTGFDEHRDIYIRVAGKGGNE
jgi:hypothetical protein